jgi:hypothetical protein
MQWLNQRSTAMKHKPRCLCPYCIRIVTLNKDDTVRRHIRSPGSKQQCIGARMPRKSRLVFP